MTAGQPTILFILIHGHNADFFVPLADVLEEKGARVAFLSTDYSIEQRAWKMGRRAPNVMHTRLRERPSKRPVEGVSLEDLCRYVLDHPSLDVYYLTLFAEADHILRAYAQHFDRIGPDLVVAWNGTTPRVRAAMKLAEARGIRTLYFEQGNFPDTVICDPKGVNWEGSMRGFEVPRDFHGERIEDFLRRFAARKRREKSSRAATAEIRSRVADALVNFSARRSPFHPTLYFAHDTHVSLRRFLGRLWRYLDFKIRHRKTHRRETMALPERFVFLPLQVHDDTQVVVHSPLLRNMEQLVEETAVALPEGCHLVVKSHPADDGRRDYRLLEEMLHGHRFHFLHRADTLELVRRSACVVTINSTVGFEALALMKPVVVLGNAVYAGRGLTLDVEDIDEFPAKLAEALTFRPDPEEVKRFLDYYIFEYSKAVNFRNPDPADLGRLADSMLGRLGRVQASRPSAASRANETESDAATEKTPLVSIIMPAYNVAAFIAQAIESVLAQTYDNWELLITDDGSTDETAEVIARYDDPRVRCFRTENRGPSAARNTALQHARGDFIAFLDADDVWFPEKLAVQVDVLRRQGDVGLTYCGVRRIAEDGRRLPSHRLSLDRLPRDWCLDRILIRNDIRGPSIVMLRREVMEKTGLFPEKVIGTEEWHVWMRAALYGRFSYVSRVLAAYRVRSGALSARYDRMNAAEQTVVKGVFSHPEVRRRFTRAHLKRLWRRAQAARLYDAGWRALRSGEPDRAAANLLKSLRSSRYDIRQVILFVVSLVMRLPWVGRESLLNMVRK